jgi:hypothetical protein
MIFSIFAVLFLISTPQIARADGSSCLDIGYAIALCPSGCQVRITVFWNSPTGIFCYANNGATINCPPACAGEYVYTASPNGQCVDGYCEWGDLPDAIKVLRESQFAKMYIPDCRGEMRVLLANSQPPEGPQTPVRRDSAKTAG